MKKFEKIFENKKKSGRGYNKLAKTDIFNQKSKSENQDIDYLYIKLNNAKDIVDLRLKMQDVINEKNLDGFKSENFYNNIYKMKNSLFNIYNLLSLSQSRRMIGQLSEIFINKHMPIFRFFDKRFYSNYYLANKVLKSILNYNNAKVVVNDIIKAFLVDEPILIAGYQKFDNILTNWLIDMIDYNYESLNNSISGNKIKSSKIFYNFKNNKHSFNSIPYLGYGGNFFNQLNVFYDRKKLIAKQRREALIFFNKKYGIGSNKNLESEENHNFLRHNLFYKTNSFKKNSSFNQSLNLSYEDKMFFNINSFYNRKFLILDNQQNLFINQQKAKLNNFSNKLKYADFKNFLSKNLNSLASLEPIKNWSDPKVKSQPFNYNSFFSKVLNITANKSKNIIFSKTSNLNHTFNIQPNYSLSLFILRKRNSNPNSSLNLLSNSNNNSFDIPNDDEKSKNKKLNI